MTHDELRRLAESRLAHPPSKALARGVLDLLSEIKELGEHIEELEEHGPNCRCRECYIDWPED